MYINYVNQKYPGKGGNSPPKKGVTIYPSRLIS